MKGNVAIVSIAYLLTVGVTLSWVFLSRQKRVPRSIRTAVCVSLRTLPLFLLLLIACQRLGLNVLVAVAFLAMVLWVLLISPGGPWMGAIGLLYVVQQWILGWPDRVDLLLEPPSSCEAGRISSDELVGKRGVAACPLRPGGIIVLDDVEYPAQSDLGYVDRGLDVIVVGRRDGSLLVRSAASVSDTGERRRKEPSNEG